MNKTSLNSLALHSFQRKARKIHKRIQIINLMDQDFSIETIVQSFDTLILWGDENGFYSIKCGEFDTYLVSLINFPEKYDYDEVHHFGILTADEEKLYIYRCFEQYPDEKGKMVTYGLQFMIDKFRDELDREYQQQADFEWMRAHGGTWGIDAG